MYIVVGIGGEDKEFPTAYTVEGTIGGGPGMLLMALMQDD